MKGIASLFSPQMRDELKKYGERELSDEHDYTDDELAELYGFITGDYTDTLSLEYDDESGQPLGRTAIFEGMIDVFVKNNLPM